MTTPNPPQFPRWPLPPSPFTERQYQTWHDMPDAKELRLLRDTAVGHAVYMHGDANITFERPEAVAEMLQTAQEIVDWILDGGEIR